MQLSNYSGKFFGSSNVLNSFLSDVRRYPVPTVKEEEELFNAYRNGDEGAKDRLILGNLRFLYSLAKIYARNESEVMDYVNEGIVGLIDSMKCFDPSKGYKMLTYGVWYIRRQMNYYMLTKRDIIGHSSQVGNILKKSDLIRQKYYAENGILPTTKEVKDILKKSFNISVFKDEDLFEMGVKSIDEDVSEDYTVEDTGEYNEKTASANDYEKTVENEHRNALLKEYLSILDAKTADIVKMRFGVGYERPYTDTEIGTKYGIEPSRIEGVCRFALDEMKKLKVKKAV